MAHNDNFAGSAPVAPFDAARWFADWSDHGGVAIVTGERLFVSRIAAIDSRAGQRLDALRGQIMHPEAAQALVGLLLARREGPKPPLKFDRPGAFPRICGP